MRRTREVLAAAALLGAAALVVEGCGTTGPKPRAPIVIGKRHDTGPKVCPAPVSSELSHTIAVAQLDDGGRAPGPITSNATSRTRAVTWGGALFRVYDAATGEHRQILWNTDV